MPEERDIEKQLRDYARQRREQSGTPPEMPPATRRILHSEIAKLPRDRRESSAGFLIDWLKSPWRLALGASVAMAVALLAILLGPQLLRGPEQPTDSLFARSSPPGRSANLPLSTTQPGVASAPSVPPPTASNLPAPGLASSATTLLAEGGTPSSNEVSPARSLTLQKSTESNSETLMARSEGNAGSFASPVAPTNAPALAATDAAANVSNSTATIHYDRFNNFFAGNADPRMSNVLRSFRVERSGAEIRLIDEGDGSVYVGQATNLPSPAAVLARSETVSSNLADATSLTAGGPAPAAAAVPVGPTNQAFAFAVSGTNVTLNQFVVLAASVGAPPVGRGGVPGAAAGRGGRGGGLGGGRGGAGPGAPIGGGGPPGGGAPAAGGGSGGGGFGGGGLGGGGRAAGGVAVVAASNLMTGTVVIGTNRFNFNARPAR